MHSAQNFSRRFLIGFVLFSQLIFSSLTYANSSQPLSCASILNVGPSRAELRAQAQAIFDQREAGISGRGFISTNPGLTPELYAEASAFGLMWWGLRIYIADSIEAAKLHSEQEPNFLLQGVYLIRHASNGEVSGLIGQPALDVFKSLVRNEGLYFINRGRVERISDEFISRRLNPDLMVWNLLDAPRGPFLYQNGWAFPKERGVLLYSDTLNSETWKKNRKIAKKLLSEGWKVTFNKDFRASLDFVARQKRKVGNDWVANSRYLDETVYNSTLANFVAGKAYSIEIWNEKGELAGGIIGNKNGSLYSPDSVFYDNVKYPQISIGLSKIALIALTDRLEAAGIHFQDTGMVTHFTESMKARYVSAAEFIDLMKTLPAENRVDFSTDWTGE